MAYGVLVHLCMKWCVHVFNCVFLMPTMMSSDLLCLLPRDNWQLMVTEEIKTIFRKANRQVDKHKN